MPPSSTLLRRQPWAARATRLPTPQRERGRDAFYPPEDPGVPAGEMNGTSYEAAARGSPAAGRGYRCRSLTPSAATRRRPPAGSGTAVSLWRGRERRHSSPPPGSRLPQRTQPLRVAITRPLKGSSSAKPAPFSPGVKRNPNTQHPPPLPTAAQAHQPPPLHDCPAKHRATAGCAAFTVATVWVASLEKGHVQAA